MVWTFLWWGSWPISIFSGKLSESILTDGWMPFFVICCKQKSIIVKFYHLQIGLVWHPLSSSILVGFWSKFFNQFLSGQDLERRTKEYLSLLNRVIRDRLVVQRALFYVQKFRWNFKGSMPLIWGHIFESSIYSLQNHFHCDGTGLKWKMTWQCPGSFSPQPDGGKTSRPA